MRDLGKALLICATVLTSVSAGPKPVEALVEKLFVPPLSTKKFLLIPDSG